ncbi:MAG: hypothetical protein HYY17_15365 [Planctomycetes bacterium]|nr:hypothetical protein [Planctomycetota bacterium]
MVDTTRLRRKGPLCRFCGKSVDWRNLRTNDRKDGTRTFHRVYWCPHCRAILEYTSWQSRG